jgi:sugar/nucleoside kinase (ribokinase family)
MPARWANRELLVPCFQVEAAGTTGSGDATIAGLLTDLLQGMAPEAAVRSAVAVGACSVERVDATSGIPTWQAVQERIAASWPSAPLRITLPSWQQDGNNVWRSPRDI